MKQIILCFLIILVLSSCGKPPKMKSVQGEKILIVNADDLCLDEESNRAILEAYHSGIVTSTSAFVTFPNSIQSLQRIHKENPDFPIGIHLNLTEGKPILTASDIPSLVDKNGNFYSPEQIISHLADMKTDEVRKEFNAQVKLFLSSGVPLDHIDCHHHMAALFTPFHVVMREISIQYKVPMRNPVPFSIYKTMKLRTGGGGSFAAKKVITYGMLHPFKSIPLMKKIGPDAFIEQEKINKSQGVNMPEWFIDAFFENATVDDLNSIIQQLPQGISELMCHPGRPGENQILSDPAVRKKLEECRISLSNYDFIRKAANR
jgi:predicted glycoside hydrolase/deacetylase ChbG (UPF0249 family)